MSDFDELLKQIHKSLETSSPDSIPEDVDVSAPAPEEEFVPFRNMTVAPDLPSPEVVEDKTVENSSAAAVKAPVSESSAIEGEEKAEAKPIKSMFRRNNTGAGSESDGFSAINSFADRFSAKSNESKDSAFDSFLKKEANAEKEAEPVITVNNAVFEEEDDVKPVTGAESFNTKAIDKDSIMDSIEKALDIPDDEGDEPVKVAEKSEILAQLATADEEGGLGDDAIRNVEAAVAANIKALKKDKEEKENSQSGEKTRKSLSEIFSAEAVRRFRLRWDHLDPALNRLDGVEYKGIRDSLQVKEAVSKESRKTFIRMCAVALLALVMFIMSIVATASASKNGAFTVFGGSNVTYSIVNLIFLLAGAGIMFPELRAGVYSALRLKPRATTVLVCIYLSSLLQCFGSLFTKQSIEADYHMLTAAVLMVSVPVLLAKVKYYENTAGIVGFLSKPALKGVLRKVESPAVLSEMLRSDASEKTVSYPAQTRFVENVPSGASDAAAATEIRGRLYAIFAILSVVIGIIGAIAAKNFMFGISAMTAAVIFSFPVTSLVSGAFFSIKENRKNIEKDAAILSAEDAKKAVASENIVVNDDELFTGTIIASITKKVSESQAEYLASILAASAGGVLARTFKDTIEEKQAGFPPVDEFVCENRLGVSGWISNCKLLLGNKQFMETHTISIPFDYIESALDSSTEKLYLSVNGDFACCFAIRYSPVKEVVGNLRELVKQGTNLIIIASDPNLSDDVIEKMLSFPADSVRVMSASTIPGFASERGEVTQGESSGFIFAPGFAGFSEAVGSALRFVSFSKFSVIVSTAVAIFGLILAGVFAVTGAAAVLAPWFVLILQGIFIAAGILMPDALPGTGTKTDEKIRPVKLNRFGKGLPHVTYVENKAPETQVREPEKQETEKVVQAPVYVAVNEEPDPGEETVTPAIAVAEEQEQLTEEERKKRELQEIIDFLDRHPAPHTPRPKQQTGLEKLASGLKSTAGSVKKNAISLKDRISEKAEAATSEHNGFDDYGDQ